MDKIFRTEFEADFEPAISYKWSIDKNRKLGKIIIEGRSDELFIGWPPANSQDIFFRKVILYRSPRQKYDEITDAKQIFSCRDLLAEIQTKHPVLPFSVMNFLAAHSDYIPEDWRIFWKDRIGYKSTIIFLGTIASDSVGNQYAWCMSNDSGSKYWSSGQVALSSHLNFNYAAAVLE